MLNKEFHGVGIFVTNDGSVFEGTFKEGLKNGHGRLIDNHGNLYHSIWHEGTQKGYAEYIGSDGTNF